MYRRLTELKLISERNKIELFDGIIADKEMESELNYLIEDQLFEEKKDYETSSEYKFRIEYHKFIVNRVNLKGDVAKALTYMQINKIKYGVKYNEKYESILNKIEKYYTSVNVKI